jgi:hypothetical protein
MHVPGCRGKSDAVSTRPGVEFPEFSLLYRACALLRSVLALV